MASHGRRSSSGLPPTPYSPTHSLETDSLRTGHRASESASLDPASYAVLTGQVGGSFGPFPRSSVYSNGGVGAHRYRDSVASSDVAIDLAAQPGIPYDYGRRSPDSDDEDEEDGRPMKERLADARRVLVGSSSSSALLDRKGNEEADDYLHDPNPELDRYMDSKMKTYSLAGIIDTGAIAIIVIVLIGLFGGWPIYTYVIKTGFSSTNDLNGGTIPSQVPNITGLPGLIDGHTPTSVYSRTGFDGEEYHLVFSDEFNTDGRTFWPGDDPWWEAVDIHYSGTSDLEWYDPDAITTKDGNLEITLTQEPIHNLNFRSGMLQSWNKFCFTGGYIEVNMSFPENANTQGYWPAAWTIGNLARPGYGASNDGTWPYSYSACDPGTLPNQTRPDGTPVAAKKSGSSDYGGELSWLPGQRLSACTCAQDKDEHPGPNVKVGRGAPEIDIIEAQIASTGVVGSASQSLQIAPMDANYSWYNSSPYIQVWDDVRTTQNQWHGSIYQESMSLQTLTDATSYDGKGYSTFGFEYEPGRDGRVTWAMNQTQTWQLNAAAMGPNNLTEIDQRLVSEEPMSIVLNLAISNKFQTPQWGKLTFPGVYRIDYVRVYQTGTTQVGCDPDDHPTSKYIRDHPLLYNNANLTVFSESNYTLPRNSLSTTGCN